MQIHHSKRKGEYAEARFLAKMLELGYTVSKPWGDSARYDFIIESGVHSPIANRKSPMVRVQVKSCWRRTGNHYAFRTTGNTPRHPTYTARDLDVIAALVVPLDLWYIVPISAISPDQSFFYVFPDRDHVGPDVSSGHAVRSTADYERFRAAWHLLP